MKEAKGDTLRASLNAIASGQKPEAEAWPVREADLGFNPCGADEPLGVTRTPCSRGEKTSSSEAFGAIIDARCAEIAALPDSVLLNGGEEK